MGEAALWILLGVAFAYILRLQNQMQNFHVPPKADCEHEWSEWQHFTTDYAYVQHRECTKCKFIFTEQLQKLQPPQEKVK